jgi:hypothetical protein
LAPSLSFMSVTSNLGNGIHGGNGTAGGVVNGAALANLIVSNNGDNTGSEDGILFQGLLGTATFGTLNVSGSARSNISVINNTGTLTSLTVSGSTIHDTGLSGSNGLAVIADGTAVMTVSVSTTSFTFNHATGFLAQTQNGGTLTATVNGGTYTNNFVSVEFDHASSGSMTGTFTGGTIMNTNGCTTVVGLACGAPVNIFLSNAASNNVGSILRATITNNTINNGGSANAPGIWIHTGTPVRGHVRALITGNNISNIDERGIAVEGGGCIAPAVCDATVDATIQNNTISLASAGSLDAVHFNVGTAGTLANNNDTLVYCAEISNNSLDSDGTFNAARLRQRSLTTIRLPGYAGSATDTAAVAAFLAGKNTEPDGDGYSIALQAGGGGYQNTVPAGTACLTP